MKTVRVLVFPCGSEIGLEIHNALKEIPFIELIGASSVDDHGKFVYRQYAGGLPYIGEPGFLERLNEAIDARHVDFVFPALDAAILFLAENRERIHAEVLAPALETVRVCNSKAVTYETFAECRFVPRVYGGAEEVGEYPVIIKPSVGCGSKGFLRVESRDELVRQLAARKDRQVICEYLSGEEYTVDCFSDRHGALKYASCRNRKRVRNGISVQSQLQQADAEVRAIADEINARLQFRGAWFFQLKRNQAGEYRLLEIAARIAGTSCVQRAAGVNLPLLTVFDAMGYDVEIEPQFEAVEVARALGNSFVMPYEYDEVIIDYDDTIIVHGRVSLTAIQFLYQAVNNNIPITLVTKHQGDIAEALDGHRIARGLFDKIIHIEQNTDKTSVMTPSKNAIYIDDSFSERRAVVKKFGIKALGVDALEALIDTKQ